MGELTRCNQWISTQQVLNWFKNLQNKDKLSFFWMDVVSFYPNITLRLLKRAIGWARQYITITDDDEKLLYIVGEHLPFMKEDLGPKRSTQISTYPWEAWMAPKSAS